MPPDTNTDPRALVEMTVDLVSSYVSNNSVNAADIPQIIAAVHAAMGSLGMPAPVPVPEKQLPAISIKKSVTDDFLISLEDGKPYKSLKRHLGRLGLTPDQYRAKWGLPSTYPTVAPNYAKRRSELAHAIGLGRKRTEPEPVPTPAPEPVAAPARRGRPKKV